MHLNVRLAKLDNEHTSHFCTELFLYPSDNDEHCFFAKSKCKPGIGCSMQKLQVDDVTKHIETQVTQIDIKVAKIWYKHIYIYVWFRIVHNCTYDCQHTDRQYICICVSQTKSAQCRTNSYRWPQSFAITLNLNDWTHSIDEIWIISGLFSSYLVDEDLCLLLISTRQC